MKDSSSKINNFSQKRSTCLKWLPIWQPCFRTERIRSRSRRSSKRFAKKSKLWLIKRPPPIIKRLRTLRCDWRLSVSEPTRCAFRMTRCLCREDHLLSLGFTNWILKLYLHVPCTNSTLYYTRYTTVCHELYAKVFVFRKSSGALNNSNNFRHKNFWSAQSSAALEYKAFKKRTTAAELT